MLARIANILHTAPSYFFEGAPGLLPLDPETAPHAEENDALLAFLAYVPGAKEAIACLTEMTPERRQGALVVLRGLAQRDLAA